MNGIVVKSGIILDKTDHYILYEMYMPDTNKYYMCLPTNNRESYQMVVDFPEEYYKSLLDKDIIAEIKENCDILYQTNANYIYILPSITTYDLYEAKKENDDHAYQNLLRKLQKYTYSTYNSLSSNNDINISNVICFITQTDDDKKFINYLETAMPGYFTSIDLSHRLKEDIVNEDTDWTTMGGPTNGGEIKEHTSNLTKPKTKKLIPPSKHGFLNITFIMVIILLSLIIGIGVAIMLIK